MRWIQHSVWLVCGLLTGCGSSSPAAPDTAQPSAPTPTAFDPAQCGHISGRVTWDGPVPIAPPAQYGVASGEGSFELRPMPNPNRPIVDPVTNGVGGAVVFLVGVDERRAKPWEMPPPCVELRDLQILIKQGDDSPKRAGFVRRGGGVQMASVEPKFHVLRGRGAAYFSLAFPDPNKPLTRTFDKAGRVELSSGAGYHWAHANLFVADHPYYALTDRQGRFSFESVPASALKVVAWHPNWWPTNLERDPETGLVSRMTYAAPLEVTTPVTVEAGRTTTAELRLR